jgi:hypothetical protein
MKAPVGRVYVLSNPAMPGLLKIGYTMNTVEGRVKELSLATGVPTQFSIEYQVECRDPAGLEAHAHTFFQSKRYNGNREFFSISINEAIDVLRQNAIELLAEELSENAKENSLIKVPATLYLVRVNQSRNIFRLGLFQQTADFLQSDEFRLRTIELYQKFDSNFFYICEVVKCHEFFCSSNRSFQEMRQLVDGNVMRLKELNKLIIYAEAKYPAKKNHPDETGKFDYRTIAFKKFDESVLFQIYNSSFSLIQPIAKACEEKYNKSVDAARQSIKNFDF